MKTITAHDFFILIRAGRRHGRIPHGELFGTEKYLVNRKIFDMVQPYIQHRLVTIPKIKKIYQLNEIERQCIFSQSCRTHMTMKDVRDMLDV